MSPFRESINRVTEGLNNGAEQVSAASGQVSSAIRSLVEAAFTEETSSS